MYTAEHFWPASFACMLKFAGNMLVMLAGLLLAGFRTLSAARLGRAARLAGLSIGPRMTVFVLSHINAASGQPIGHSAAITSSPRKQIGWKSCSFRGHQHIDREIPSHKDFLASQVGGKDGPLPPVTFLGQSKLPAETTQ